ncbi:hypothetical protein QJQ45_024213 [Haematococcus lacustris]|nr:hypothetical protein QJQ45_024213 [Haematococcus lacustris]
MVDNTQGAAKQLFTDTSVFTASAFEQVAAIAKQVKEVVNDLNKDRAALQSLSSHLTGCGFGSLALGLAFAFDGLGGLSCLLSFGGSLRRRGTLNSEQTPVASLQRLVPHPCNGWYRIPATMSSSSEEEGGPSYSRSPQWADVQPLEAAEAGRVVAVQYTPEFREALAYFRAVRAKGERSQRVLELTADIIRHNQADYSAWQLRWECLLALGSDLLEEYTFTDAIMEDNAKNYQLWNHRRKCCLVLGQGALARELQVTTTALAADAKNYHAWAHRQALVKAWGGELWSAELAYSEHCLEDDVRNNSAWNQRAFVLRHQLQAMLQAGHGGGSSSHASSTKGPVEELVQRELTYVARLVAKAPRNDSAWNYLGGLFRQPGMPAQAMAWWPEVHTLCTEALLDVPSCPPAMDVLCQYYQHCASLAAQRLAVLLQEAAANGVVSDPAAGSAAGTSNRSVASCPAASSSRDDVNAGSQSAVGSESVKVTRDRLKAAGRAVIVLCNHLLVADPVRTMYWLHRQQDVEALLNGMGVPAGPGASSASPATVAET